MDLPSSRLPGFCRARGGARSGWSRRAASACLQPAPLPASCAEAGMRRRGHLRQLPARARGKRTPLCWVCGGENLPISAGFLLKINGGGRRNEGVTVENLVTQLQCWPQPHYLPHRWRQLPHYSLRLSLALRFFMLGEMRVCVCVCVRERGRGRGREREGRSEAARS